MSISKIELLENEHEISRSRLELLEKEYDRIFQEYEEIHCELSTKMRDKTPQR
jgi:archaellum component FlaC